MKQLIYILTFLTFLISSESKAQKTERFYNYLWKECPPNEARFYSLITKTDSGYFRKDYYIKERKIQMIGNYSDSLCKIRHGEFTFYHPNGSLESYGQYIRNKKEGKWICFHQNGFMRDSTVYSDGKQTGKSLSWHSNGYIRDSVVLNTDGSGTHVSWFDNGVPAAAGVYTTDMKQHGKWKYFHKNGKMSSVEIYDNSKLVSKQYFDENGELLEDTTCTDRQAEFVGGIDAWIKFISKYIYFPSRYKIVNADVAKVVVTFTVNEEGEVENVFTSTPFDKVFDSIAEKAIKKSPKWIPAIKHNRRVKSTFNQVVNFQNYIE
ncbi:MAG: hypothetical protein VB066_04455 [Paludibacter sp.]|nr:hypothetical protein [Paludibacter sp.]